MRSLAENLEQAKVAERKEFFPSIRISAKTFPELKNKKLGAKLNLNIIAEITDISQHNDNPKEFRIELKQGEIAGSKKE